MEDPDGGCLLEQTLGDGGTVRSCADGSRRGNRRERKGEHDASVRVKAWGDLAKRDAKRVKTRSKREQDYCVQ
jgi:hypothetical protein